MLGQFFMGNQTISEGVAEMFPLYGLGLEEMFEEHREVIVNLSKNQILSAKELLNSEKDGTFGNSAVLQNKSCSFRYSYISAYLLVRGLIENIEECYKLSKSDAIQYFLEVLRTCNYRNEWLIYDIANALNLNQEELLVGKDIQLGVVNKLKKVRNNKE